MSTLTQTRSEEPSQIVLHKHTQVMYTTIVHNHPVEFALPRIPSSALSE